MTMSPSTLRLRSTLALLLFAGATACVEDPPPSNDTSGTTVAADSSTGAGVSATSTTGGPMMTTTGTTFEPSTESSTSGGSGDETDSSFIFTPDGGVCVYGGAPDGFQPRCSYCDVGLQDCPPGEKCVPWANDGGELWNATRCSPIPEDPRGLGESCVAEDSPVSGFDDCDLGALCFGVDPRTLQGTCTALCNVDEAGSCGEEVCVAYNDFEPFVCMPRCDPLDAATCPADQTCRPIGDDIVCVPRVTLPQGLECGAAEQYCTADQACMWADLLASCDDPQCCRPWCDLTAPDPDLPCAAVPGEVCRPFFDAAPAGYEHVGVCGLPV